MLESNVPEFEYAQVADRVYVGRNPITVADVERLANEVGITHVIDLRETWEYAPPRHGEAAVASLSRHRIHRDHVPVTDMGAPTHTDLDACIDYMQQAFVDPMARLYLHCRAGRERSGCVAVAWCAREHGIGYDEALSRLQMGRPQIQPLPGQERAVRAWLNHRTRNTNDTDPSAHTVSIMEDHLMPPTHSSSERTPETVRFYHSAVIVKINQRAQKTDVYTAARYAWRVSPVNAAKHRLVLAAVHGVVVGVFDKVQWQPATEENFPGFSPKLPHKWGFTAVPAADGIASLYVGLRLPDRMMRRGAVAPVWYVDKEVG